MSIITLDFAQIRALQTALDTMEEFTADMLTFPQELSKADTVRFADDLRTSAKWSAYLTVHINKKDDEVCFSFNPNVLKTLQRAIEMQIPMLTDTVLEWREEAEMDTLLTLAELRGIFKS